MKEGVAMAKKKQKNSEDILSLIKTEYISDPKTSYRKLAEKYKYPLKKIAAAGRKEGWGQLRVQVRDKTLKKTINRISTEKADELADVITNANKVLKVIGKAFEDDKQFNRHIVINNKITQEKVYKKVDTRALRDITTCLKDIAAVGELMKQGNEDNEGKSIEIILGDGEGYDV